MPAILLMLNNYFHDLATALFAVSALAAWSLHRALPADEALGRLRPVITGLVRLGHGALAWILLAGVVRVIYYRDYEWSEAAGRAQVPALVAKHVVLVGATAFGLAMLVALRRRLRREPPGGAR